MMISTLPRFSLAFLIMLAIPPALAQSPGAAEPPAMNRGETLTRTETGAPPAADATERESTSLPGSLSERERRDRLARALMLLAAPGGRPFPLLSR